MKKKILLLMVVFSLGIVHAQVGINTQTPLGIFHIDPKEDTSGGITNTSDDIIVTATGNVGIGTISPDARMHIKTDNDTPAFKLQDGNEKSASVLISDESGNATWGRGLIGSVIGKLGVGATMYLPDYKLTGLPYIVKDTGSYIDLPPGRWLVYVTFQLPPLDASKHDSTPAYWIRSTFYDSPALVSLPGFSSDIEDGSQISGSGWYDTPGIVSGFTILKNTGVKKKYYLYIGLVSFYKAAPYTITIGGNGHPENSIVAIQLNS